MAEKRLRIFIVICKPEFNLHFKITFVIYRAFFGHNYFIFIFHVSIEFYGFSLVTVK